MSKINAKSKKFSKKGVRGNGRNNAGAARDKCDSLHPIDRDTSRGQLMDAHKSQPNDWRWYAQNEQLLKDTASYPYSWPLGNKLSLDNGDNPINRGSVPGIFVLKTAPAYGISTNADSPINVASRKIYTYVRHENSGGKNYDPVDLMLYLMSMDGAISYLSWLKRLYGTINLYNYTNRYFPKAAIVAQNVDYDDLLSHIADFRAYINTFAVRIGALCIPNSIAYMAKHAWMYSGMYQDSQSDKAQVYMFSPSTYSVFGLDEDGAGCLKNYNLWGFTDGQPNNTWKGRLKYSDLIATGEAIIAPLINSEDCGIMSGDILKAYGQSGVYQVDGISESYVVIPTYDATVLDQIHNATTVGEPSSETGAENESMRLKQDATKGWLEFNPTFYNTSLANNAKAQKSAVGKKFINFMHGDVGPAETMEATRMMNIPAWINADGETGYKSLGSEVVINFAIYFYAQSSTGVWSIQGSDDLYTYTNIALAANLAVPTSSAAKEALDKLAHDVAMDLRVLCQLTQFDRHPAVYLSQTGQFQLWNSSSEPGRTDWTDTKSNGVWGIMQDLNYYAVVDADNLANMDMTALLSEFFTRNAGEA